MIFDNLFEGESRGESLLFNFLFLHCVGVFGAGGSGDSLDK